MKEYRQNQLMELAATRHGVFTRRDAVALGVAKGRYKRISPGVYAVVGSPSTRRQKIAAAVSPTSSLSAISHGTAAEMWGLTNRGIKHIDIVTTRWDRVGVRESTSMSRLI